jgi:hypothetical protein
MMDHGDKVGGKPHCWAESEGEKNSDARAPKRNARDGFSTWRDGRFFFSFLLFLFPLPYSFLSGLGVCDERRRMGRSGIDFVGWG